MHFDGDQKIEDVKSEKDDSFDIPSSSLPKSNAQEKEALSKVRHYYIPVQEKGQWKFDTFCDLQNVVSMSKTIIFVNNTKFMDRRSRKTTQRKRLQCICGC
uniref:Uncharacterized protein n=1 Tax=Ditylenchus dipsaci TaxID=166011 RepID=A0A915ETF6_9BILA